MSRGTKWTAAIVLLLGAGACQIIAGIDDRELAKKPGTGGTNVVGAGGMVVMMAGSSGMGGAGGGIVLLDGAAGVSMSDAPSEATEVGPPGDAPSEGDAELDAGDATPPSDAADSAIPDATEETDGGGVDDGGSDADPDASTSIDDGSMDGMVEAAAPDADMDAAPTDAPDDSPTG